MNKKFFFLFLAGIVAVSILTRLLPHPANFTPIAALALFSGVYASKFSKWYLFTPLAAMLASDVFVGFYEPKTMMVVYGSFLTIGLFGLLAQKRKNIATVGVAALSGSVLFFLTTNAAVWAFSGMYAPTLNGLMLSYSMAIPFLKFTILGDLFYVGLFFGAYEFALAFVAKKKERHGAALEGVVRTTSRS